MQWKKIGVARFTGTENSPVLTYFPELTGKVLAGFENIYPYSKENVFIASENGILHLNYEKYIGRNPTLQILLTQVKIIGKNDSVIFGGHFPLNDVLKNIQAKSSVLHFPIDYNSFHFEFSSPAFSLQNNIEYSYQLEGYESKWSAWTLKTEKIIPTCRMEPIRLK
ncbi:MAG: hypothetical protein IPK31_18415 [Chitinophagaceae bacterium]|nr:hypothetical protein [Chitinophagaceae bacterium]